MVERLRVLGASLDEELEDDDLRVAADAAFGALQDRDVDIDGVAPVLNEDDRVLEADLETIAEHIVESHGIIDDRLEDIERRLDRAERDIDTIDGGY